MSAPYNQQPQPGQQPQYQQSPYQQPQYQQSPYQQSQHQQGPYQQSPMPQQVGPPEPAPKRPWYKKKRFVIPGGVLAALIAIGIVSPSSDEAPEAADTAAEPEVEVAATEELEPEAEPEDAEEAEAAAIEEAEAAEEPEAEPTPTEQAVPEGSTYAGDGSSVIMLDEDMSEVWTADINYSGGGHFAVWTVDENGQQLDLLVNHIDGYSGAVGLNLKGDTLAALDVEASGPWTIETMHVSQSPRWDLESTYEADGDHVVLLDPTPEGLHTVTIEHAGQGGNFAVWAYADSAFGPNLLVNEIGTYSGQDLLPNGTFLLEVSAEGSWTITSD